MTLDQIAAGIAPNAATRDALRSWLDFGVAAKVLGESGGRYRIRSALAKYVADPQNDSAAAFVEEAVMMDAPAVVRMPSLLKRGELFKLSDQMPEVVARSSRILEPFIFDALDAMVPRRGTFRLLDVGCGSGTYIRHVADRNPELRALGGELQPAVAAFARDNLSKWGVGARATVEAGDIRNRTPSGEFDLAMLNNNIYYFPVCGELLILEKLVIRPTKGEKGCRLKGSPKVASLGCCPSARTEDRVAGSPAGPRYETPRAPRLAALARQRQSPPLGDSRW